LTFWAAIQSRCHTAGCLKDILCFRGWRTI